MASVQAVQNRARDAGRVPNLILPGWLLLPATLALLFLLGPVVALLFNIPWHRSWELLTQPESLQPLGLSLRTAVLATVICTLLGSPLALALHHHARNHPRWVAGIQVLVYAPLVLSPVVSGLALTFLWGRRGLLGQHLDQVGVQVAFTTTAVVITQVFVALPFFVPGVVTGMILGFARALGEYGATLTFAGNVAGVTRTIPLHIELGLSSNDMDQALGAVIMLLAVYVLIIGAIGVTRMISRQRR